MNRQAKADHALGSNDADALVAEFVESWRGLEGDAWIAHGGRDEVRRMIVEAVTTMVGDGAPESRRRVLAWATADLASLELPGSVRAAGLRVRSMAAGGRHRRRCERGRSRDRRPHRRGAADRRRGERHRDHDRLWAVAETGTIALDVTPATGRSERVGDLDLAAASVEVVKSVARWVSAFWPTSWHCNGPPLRR